MEGLPGWYNYCFELPLQIFPSNREDLAAEVERYLPQNVEQCYKCIFGNSGKNCLVLIIKIHCLMTILLESPGLMRCYKCQMIKYCEAECQLSHWRTGHKKLCAQSRIIFGLANFNFDHFEGYQSWPDIVTYGDHQGKNFETNKNLDRMNRMFTEGME